MTKIFTRDELTEETIDEIVELWLSEIPEGQVPVTSKEFRTRWDRILHREVEGSEADVCPIKRAMSAHTDLEGRLFAVGTRYIDLYDVTGAVREEAVLLSSRAVQFVRKVDQFCRVTAEGLVPWNRFTKEELVKLWEETAE